MPLTDETTGLTVDMVKAEIEQEQERSRTRLRHLRALLRCLKDEVGGQKDLPFDEAGKQDQTEDTPDGK